MKVTLKRLLALAMLLLAVLALLTGCMSGGANEPGPTDDDEARARPRTAPNRRFPSSWSWWTACPS